MKLVSLFVFPFQRALGNQKATIVEFSNKDDSEINSEQDKENSLIKNEPRRIKIFDGGQVHILFLNVHLNSPFKCTFAVVRMKTCQRCFYLKGFCFSFCFF